MSDFGNAYKKGGDPLGFSEYSSGHDNSGPGLSGGKGFRMSKIPSMFGRRKSGGRGFGSKMSKMTRMFGSRKSGGRGFGSKIGGKRSRSSGSRGRKRGGKSVGKR